MGEQREALSGTGRTVKGQIGGFERLWEAGSICRDEGAAFRVHRQATS